MPIHSKNKGASFEREVAQILREAGFDARRGCQFSGGAESPDVVSNFPFHIEAKRVEKLNLDKALEQSKKDAGKNKFCVIHRKSRQVPMITCPLEFILPYLK